MAPSMDMVMAASPSSPQPRQGKLEWRSEGFDGYLFEHLRHPRQPDLYFCRTASGARSDHCEPGYLRVVSLGLPGIYRVSVNPGPHDGPGVRAEFDGTSITLRQLSAAQTIAYSGGASTWPKAAVDCEPQNGPLWCLFQRQSPDATDATGNSYGASARFRPTRASGFLVGWRNGLRFELRSRVRCRYRFDFVVACGTPDLYNGIANGRCLLPAQIQPSPCPAARVMRW